MDFTSYVIVILQLVNIHRDTRAMTKLSTGIVNLVFVFEQRSIWIGALVMRHPV